MRAGQVVVLVKTGATDKVELKQILAGAVLEAESYRIAVVDIAVVHGKGKCRACGPVGVERAHRIGLGAAVGIHAPGASGGIDIAVAVAIAVAVGCGIPDKKA